MEGLMNQYKVSCLLVLHFLVFWPQSLNTTSLCPPDHTSPPYHFASLNSKPLCHTDQSSALLHFKSKFSINSTASVMDCDEDAGIKSYPKTNTWKDGTDCCSWDGVTCDELTGNVIGLDLSCSWLYGNFPTNSNLLVLSHLQRLNFAHNHFHGCQIPSDFGQLVSLTHLNLSFSMFSGIIPSEISHLSKLLSLDLSFNFDLRIDRDTFEMLSKNLTEIAYLFLDQVNMSSVMPNTFLNLSSLVSLSLFNCQLQGKFPLDFFHLPYLKELKVATNKGLEGVVPMSNWTGPLELLDLSGTSFSGELQYSIGNLKSLKVLNLESCEFIGPIPASLWNLTGITHLDISSNSFRGQIPSSLANLEQLTLLDLSLNYFEGQIPDVFYNLSRLFSLAFVNNNFTGPLPSSVFNLSQLSRLDLSGNQLEGTMPYNVSGLSELINLSLSGNRLNGIIPSWLVSLSLLEELRLSGNKFTGQIPEFQSKSLKYIYLDKNDLQGEIPRSIFELENLTDLFLSSNNLMGVMDLDMFSELKNLARLDLSHANLSIITTNNVNTWRQIYLLMLSSCNINEFPRFLRMQKELQYLDLSNNNLHGNIPNWMSNAGTESLILLDLSNNLLKGFEQLPWKNLQVLNLHSNAFEGSLPVPPLTVTFFSISNNNLSGEIPTCICNVRSLQILDLSSNNLSGIIPPCIGNLSKTLSVLDLQKNDFHGTIPATFEEECNLRNLNLQGNKLEGSLPPSLVNCRELEVLDIGNNMFNDTFPHWLGTLQQLKVLALRSNKFYGSIPDSTTNDSFANLQVFDLSNNNFVGHLPTRYLQNLVAMIKVDDGKSVRKYLGDTNHSYDYTVTVTIKGLEIEMQKIFYIFASIDLSRNDFKGEIPEAIGMLHSLRGLNLSHNSLSGHIPSSLGNLSSLEWLDLSANKLSGEIPEQLAELTFLSILNLSQNELIGHIPQGSQFGTFTANSYEGNLGLCGFPLLRKCGDQEPLSPLPSNSQEEDSPSFFESGFGWQSILIGYGCGIIAGVSMAYVMFQTGKPEWLMLMINNKQLGKMAGWSRSLNGVNGRRN